MVFDDKIAGCSFLRSISRSMAIEWKPLEASTLKAKSPILGKSSLTNNFKLGKDLAMTLG